MRVAVTGASGFIGSAITRLFAESGTAVTALMRSSSRRDHIDGSIDRTVEGTQDDRTCFEDLLEGADVLVHNSVDWRLIKDDRLQEHYNSNLIASIDLIDLAARRNIHVIYISSVSVHHHMLDRWEGSIDADHPILPGTLYGALKASIEAHLWAAHTLHGMSFDILRPSAVYGIDPTLSRSIGFPILQKIARGESYERTGGGKFVHVDDVARTVVASANQAGSQPEIHHLADTYARWADWASMACSLLNTEVSIDESSPSQPQNQFDCSSLDIHFGIKLDRGLNGIRSHLEQLRDVMISEGAL